MDAAISLLNIPNELLFLIGKQVTHLRDLNSLVRTNQRLYNTLIDILYKRFIQERNISHDVIPVLQTSAFLGCLRPVEKLITLGPFSADDGFSLAILAACDGGREMVVKALIERGANVNIMAGLGNTPLQSSVRNGYENIVGILIENRADMTKKYGPFKYTVLHLAARLGRTKIMALLLDAGMDINVKDNWGRTPLQTTFLSCHTPHPEDLCYLCPLEIKEEEGGNNRRTKRDPHFSIQAMGFLLQRNADIRAAGWVGSRPKDLARRHPNRMVQDLFRKYDEYDSAEEETLK